jgi:hypothetical protein
MSKITFQKRQKEMKRIEKQKMKAERRQAKKVPGEDGQTTPSFLDEPIELMTGPSPFEPEA